METADATITATKAPLDDILLAPTEEKRQALITEVKNSGRLEIKGDPNALTDFKKLLDDYPFWFNIVTPWRAAALSCFSCTCRLGRRSRAAM